MDARHPETLRILCFGDSLTAGYTRYGLEHYPYSDFLENKLRKSFPLREITIVNDGLSGDRVKAGWFLRRMEGRCAKAAAKPYNWVIVLGGTNDLGWGEAPEAIYEALKKAWNIALDTGANVLACTVIECAASGESLIRRRNALNALIAEHVQDRYHTIDLCSAVPYFAMDEDMRDKIWDDGLHLTKDGYKMIGNAIASRMIELLKSTHDPENTGTKISGAEKAPKEVLPALSPSDSFETE